ncbi:MAG: serpin family protein [Anaerolineae bacterium]
MRRRRGVSIIGLVLTLSTLIVSGCGSATPPPTAPPATPTPEADQPQPTPPASEDASEEGTAGEDRTEEVKVPGVAIASDRERVVSPVVPDADLGALVSGNSAFAFDLYRFLAEQQGDGNLFYSPYSISLALAMTYAGARGETEEQMADALQFDLPQSDLHPAFNALDQELARRGEGAEGKDEGGFRLNIANAIWGQMDYAFLDAFLDTLAENYGAGLRVLDFANAPDASRVTINDWVSEETEGKIENLIPQGTIDPLTRLVLTNAIYFNAAWANPFQEEATQDGTFTLLDGSQSTVPMMRQTEAFAYHKGKGYQAVELPYDGHEMSMVILLPDEGEFASFEDTLDAEKANTIVDSLKRGQVALTMPRFEFDSEFGLNEALGAMGMSAAFSGGADFSGMTGTRELFISDVVHKAFVSVDEEGTEAAAATAVIMKLAAVAEEPVVITIDHPFMFLIRDIETEAVLFVGRVVDPSA